MTSTTEAARAAHLHPSDLRALARIATDATTGVVDLVESMHMSIAPAALSRHASLPYRALRGATRLVGGGAEMSLAQVTELLGRRDDSPQRASALAIINGLWGDYLHNIDSPLALPMSFRYGDAALAPPRRKLLILVHGLCNDSRTWERNDSDAFAAAPGLPAADPGLPAARDYGDALARDLGYSPVYLTYNTGLHISTNGRALAMMIDALLAAWPCPVDEIALLGHSMGGLVARAYLQSHGEVRVARLVTLGTPHQGSELARIGFGANARQMRPHSAWLQALGRPQPALAALAIYSPQDNFVMPPSLLELAGAENRTIDGLGHLAMLYSPRLALILLTALEQRTGGGECAFAGADSEAAADA